MLIRFRDVPSLRRLVDEVQDPPLLVLEYLESNTLIESGKKGFQSSDAKLIAKAVLETLAAFHAEGIVHTGQWNRRTFGQEALTQLTRRYRC